MCSAYARLTQQCWAKLVRLSERPNERDLLDLQEKSLQALIKAVGGTYGNDRRKDRLAKRLMQWLEHHPGQAFPLPHRGPGGRTYAQAVNTGEPTPDGWAQRTTRPPPPPRGHRSALRCSIRRTTASARPPLAPASSGRSWTGRSGPTWGSRWDRLWS